MMIHVHVRVSLNLTAHWPKKRRTYRKQQSSVPYQGERDRGGVDAADEWEREKKMKTENAVR